VTAVCFLGFLYGTFGAVIASFAFVLRKSEHNAVELSPNPYLFSFYKKRKIGKEKRNFLNRRR
jgi:hypothetical protein